jgi:threonine dehydrogenase-like Zn-dependent dehydrogenase
MAYLVELTEPRVVGLREYPTPEPGVGEVRVQTMYSGISAGTELTIYRGTNPYLDKQWDPRTALFLPGSRFLSGSSTFSYPVDAWGYSEVGEVDAIGDDVSGLQVGDVVWGIWGHRSHAVLPESKLIGHTLPSNLDPLVATFDRVGAVALNAVLASGVCTGESVAVFGLGVIGLLTTQLLISQAAEVLAVDTVPYRLELAAKFGATPFSTSEGDLALAVREHTGGRGADRVIELTGAYPALHQAIRLAGVGGTVIAAGFYQGPATALALGEEFHHNQVTLISSQIANVPPALRNRWSRDRLHETVMRLCAGKRLDPMPLVSRVIPARQAAEAYRLLDSPPAELMQVILSFDEFSRGDQGWSPLGKWMPDEACPALVGSGAIPAGRDGA